MATVIEKTGKTVEDAIQAAVDELGVEKSEVEVEVLESPSKKLFGLFGSTPAKVRVTLKEKIEPEKISLESEIKTFSAEVSEVEEPPVAKEISSELAKQSAILEEKISEAEKIPEGADFDKTEVIERGKKFLRDVFAAMKIDVEIEVVEDEEGCIFDLSGKNLGILIGKHGQTLDALQYLLNLAANKRYSSERIHFLIDIENYRERRKETLKKLAKSVAERAVRMRQDVRLEPMNRHERKIIHTALQDNKRVETRSAGEEPYRYIIVSPKKLKRI